MSVRVIPIMATTATGRIPITAITAIVHTAITAIVAMAGTVLDTADIGGAAPGGDCIEIESLSPLYRLGCGPGPTQIIKLGSPRKELASWGRKARMRITN